MLLKEWRKFRGWLVLEFFLKTCKESYVKELARELKISPQTANYYLKFYNKEGILEKKKKGNLLLYSLAENALTRQIKILYILAVLFDCVKKLAEEHNIVSIALYGSYANGTYDANSDIDLILITSEKRFDLEEIKKIEKETGKEVKIQVFTIGEWRNLKRKKDRFVLSVLSNHILLWGAEL